MSPAASHPDVSNSVASNRAALDKKAFEAKWQAGRAVTLQAAI